MYNLFCTNSKKKLFDMVIIHNTGFICLLGKHSIPLIITIFRRRVTQEIKVSQRRRKRKRSSSSENEEFTGRRSISNEKDELGKSFIQFIYFCNRNNMHRISIAVQFWLILQSAFLPQFLNHNLNITPCLSSSFFVYWPIKNIFKNVNSSISHKKTTGF